MARVPTPKDQAALLENLNKLLAAARSHAEISGTLDRDGTTVVLRFNSETSQGAIKGDTNLARSVAEIVAMHSI